MSAVGVSTHTHGKNTKVCVATSSERVCDIRTEPTKAAEGIRTQHVKTIHTVSESPSADT